jgi:hypothetical protein
VSNHHKFPVEFSIACSAPSAFTIVPAEGVIKPQVCGTVNDCIAYNDGALLAETISAKYCIKS